MVKLYRLLLDDNKIWRGKIKSFPSLLENLQPLNSSLRFSRWLRCSTQQGSL